MKSPRCEHRAIYYDLDGRPHVVWPIDAAEDSPHALTARLERCVESGRATGGRLEMFVAGVGWVVCD